MKINKLANGNLQLQMERDYDDMHFDGILNNNDLFMQDLYFMMDNNSDMILVDNNYQRRLMYFMGDANFSDKDYYIQELKAGRMIELTPMDVDYDEYYDDNFDW